MTRVYIAAPFELIGEANMLKLLLEAKGFVVSSRWLDESPDELFENMTDHDRRQFCAARDMEDILTSHAMVLINPKEWAKIGSGGRHFESAVAVMAQLPLYIYGVETNVFHAVPEVTMVTTDLKTLIGAMRFKFGIDS